MIDIELALYHCFDNKKTFSYCNQAKPQFTPKHFESAASLTGL
jgi:hypothetical protein